MLSFETVVCPKVLFRSNMRFFTITWAKLKILLMVVQSLAFVHAPHLRGTSFHQLMGYTKLTWRHMTGQAWQKAVHRYAR